MTSEQIARLSRAIAEHCEPEPKWQPMSIDRCKTCGSGIETIRPLPRKKAK